MIINPNDKQKMRWYRCGYIEGKYIVEHFGLSPIYIDDKFYYYVETRKFDEIVNKIPMYIKIFSHIKNTKQKILIFVRRRRRKR